MFGSLWRVLAVGVLSLAVFSACVSSRRGGGGSSDDDDSALMTGDDAADDDDTVDDDDTSDDDDTADDDDTTQTRVDCSEKACSPQAWCNDSLSCICKPGFVQDGEDCVEPPYLPPDERTEAEVCTRYQEDLALTAAVQHVDGAGPQCIPGEPTRAALNDGLSRLNLYRWLAGVEPAWDLPGLNEQGQACALMMDQAEDLSHSPGTSWPCYTELGAAGAASSNLALNWGGMVIAGSVDQYIGDLGTPSIGHRRWCLKPELGETGFGVFSLASCMYAFGTGNSRVPDFVAYPSPGYYPSALVLGEWSFHSYNYELSPTTSGAAFLVDSGEVVPLLLEDPGESFSLPDALKLIPATGAPLFGEVEISLTDLVPAAGGALVDLTWTVHLIDCS